MAGVNGGVASGEGGVQFLTSLGIGVCNLAWPEGLLNIKPFNVVDPAQVLRVCPEYDFLRYKLIVLPKFVAIHQENLRSARNGALRSEPVLVHALTPDYPAVCMLLVKWVIGIRTIAVGWVA